MSREKPVIPARKRGGGGAQHPEKGRGVHRARPHLDIVRFLDYTSPFREEFFESNDHVLIVHAPPSEQDTQPEAGAAAPGIIGKERLVWGMLRPLEWSEVPIKSGDSAY